MRIPHAHAPKTPKHAPRAGYSLIDTVITVLVLGILAAAATPKFADTLQKNRADSAARRIRADLSLCRQQAVARSTTLNVDFTVSSSSYILPNITDLNSPTTGYKVDLTQYPYNVVLVSASLGGDASIQFDRYGAADSAGTITVQSGGRQQTVTIDADTGRARVP